MVNDRERVLALLQKYGWNSTSFQVLEPDFAYWFDGDDACVAYVDTGGAWVVAGGPLAAEERLGEVAQRFIAAAEKHRRRVVFFAVEQRLLHALPMPALHIGEQPWWDPREWTERHRGHRSLKEQLRRARAKGVMVEKINSALLEDSDSPLCGEVSALIARWLGSRPMPAMAFLVELHPFGFPAERRYYLARSAGKLVGVLVAVPVYLRGGWFFEDVLRDPRAPNGTVELMVETAMKEVASGGSDFVTLGLAPLAGASRGLGLARRLMRSFYNFEGLRAFKAKFRPDGWDEIYIAWPRRQSAPTAVYDALAAFARGHTLRFAIGAVLRAPPVVLALLALLLVPWTLLLASPAAARWFPAPAVQWAWVGFDIAVAAVFFALSRRWRAGVARAALAATLLDTVLTCVQAASFNLRRVRSFQDAAIIAISVAAPAAASAILAGGLRSRTPPREVDGVTAR